MNLFTKTSSVFTIMVKFLCTLAPYLLPQDRHKLILFMRNYFLKNLNCFAVVMENLIRATSISLHPHEEFCGTFISNSKRYIPSSSSKVFAALILDFPIHYEIHFH